MAKELPKCILCPSMLQTTERRKLFSPSTEHVRPFMKVLFEEHQKTLETLEPEAFVCRSCLRSVEKLKKLREDTSTKENELKEQIERIHGSSQGTPSKRTASDAGFETPKGKRKLYDTPTRKTLDTMVPGASPAVVILVKGKKKARAHPVPRSSGLKTLARGIARRSRKSIARQTLADERMRTHVLRLLKKYIQKNMTVLCSKKENEESILRGKSINAFSWDILTKELQVKAPTLYAVLKACVDVNRRPKKERKATKKRSKCRTSSNTAILGVCAAILLRHRNHHMNLIQRTIAMILNAGHSSKQVYTRLQKLNLSLSRQCTLTYLDEIGKEYDRPVLEWKSSIESEMKSLQVEELLSLSQNENSPSQDPPVDEERLISPALSNDDSLTDCTSSDGISSHSSSTCTTPTYSDFTLHSSESSIDIDAFLGLPPKSYPSRFMSFKLVGDNIDKEVRPRDMRSDHQTKSLHYFHTYAVRDRVDLAGVSDQSPSVEVGKVNLDQLLPDLVDGCVIKKNLAVLICRVLRKYMPYFKTFAKAIERHIQHEYSHEMAQKSEVVPLGIELKSEQKYEDMVQILGTLQEYVPRTASIEEVSVPSLPKPLSIPKHQFHKLLFGGDQMTAARIRGSKRVMSNSETDLDRLEGLSALVEDWHAKVIFLEVIWKRLYSTASGIDGGTFFQLRNLVNRRNIRKDPHADVNASEDFFVSVTESHILAAAMTLLEMTSLDDEPSEKYFPAKSSELDPMQRRQLMLLAANDVIGNFVKLDVSFADPQSAIGEKENGDGVQEYASETLSLGLLYLEFVDAIKEGDGERILRCWRYFLLLFRAYRRTNYAVEAFTLLAQEKFLFSPRQALQLKWSRTINTHGRPGKNIPCDLHMEHLNKECKGALSGLGSNTTDQSVKRIGKCIGKTVDMLKNFDKDNGVPKQSGHHTKHSSKVDVGKMVKQLRQTSDVFTQKPGRCHRNYPKFTSNKIRTIDLPELNKWMTNQLTKRIDYN